MVAIIFHLFLSHAFAADVLVIERVSGIGHEQVGLVLDGNTAQLTSNSNFLGQQKNLRLGEFHQTASQDIKDFFQQSPPIETDPELAQSEDIKVLWNGRSIQNYNSRRSYIRFMRKQLQDPVWKLSSGDTIDISEVQKTCKDRIGNVCRIGLGFIHF